MTTLLLIGATSAIAKSVAEQYAREGAKFALLARSNEEATKFLSHLMVLGATKAKIWSFDALNMTDFPLLIESVCQEMGKLDVTLLAYGALPDPSLSEDIKTVSHYQQINSTSVMQCLTTLAPRLAAQKNDAVLAVLTSVAGIRGRKSNYLYGANKGGVSIFLQGLDQRYHQSLRILDIKAGFVESPMTENFPKGFLWRTPNQIAPRICKALKQKSGVVFVPIFWQGIMFVIRHLPLAIFRRGSF
jgi:hypothetical protein